MQERTIISVPNGKYSQKNELEVSQSYMDNIVKKIFETVKFISCFEDSPDIITSAGKIQEKTLENHIYDERTFIEIGNKEIEGQMSIYRLCPEFSEETTIPGGALLPYIEMLTLRFQEKPLALTESIDNLIKIYNNDGWNSIITGKIQKDEIIKKNKNKNIDIISPYTITKIAEKNLDFKPEELSFIYQN